MPNHSTQKFQKKRTVTRFFQNVLQTSRIGVSNLRFHFSTLFYCFIHFVCSRFYSKSSCLIIPHKSIEKHGQLLGFSGTCFKRLGFGFPIQGFDCKQYFTFLDTQFLRHSILNHDASSFPTKVSKNVDSYCWILCPKTHSL